VNIYADGVDPVEIRRRIGMVFQVPNPFPKSVYENVAFGPRIHGYRGDLDELVERYLREAALWDEVHHRHPQHAAGGAGIGLHSLPDDERAPRRGTHRVRCDQEHLHQPQGQTHRGIYYRAVWVIMLDKIGVAFYNGLETLWGLRRKR